MGIYIVYLAFAFAFSYNFYKVIKSEKGDGEIFVWRLIALFIGFLMIIFSKDLFWIYISTPYRLPQRRKGPTTAGPLSTQPRHHSTTMALPSIYQTFWTGYVQLTIDGTKVRRSWMEKNGQNSPMSGQFSIGHVGVRWKLSTQILHPSIQKGHSSIGCVKLLHIA